MPHKRKVRGKSPGKKRTRKGPQKAKGVISKGFHAVRNRSVAGQEDAEYTTMVYEYTSAFTSTGGAASYLGIIGNTIFQPINGVASSFAGYARMYTQYQYAQVLESECEVRLWGGNSGVIEPFRVIVLPCSQSQYTVYSAYTNISSLAGVPHACQGIFAPGAKLPIIRARATTSNVIYGEAKADRAAEATQYGVYSAGTGADPTTIWSFLVGYQNFAGTSTTNQQAQIKLTYKVKWSRPIATAEQALTDYFGNEVHAKLHVRTQQQSKELKRDPTGESKISGLQDDAKIGFVSFKDECKAVLAQPTTKFASTNVRVTESDDYILVRKPASAAAVL